MRFPTSKIMSTLMVHMDRSVLSANNCQRKSIAAVPSTVEAVADILACLYWAEISYVQSVLLVVCTINPMPKYQQQDVTLIEQHSLTAMAQRAG